MLMRRAVKPAAKTAAAAIKAARPARLVQKANFADLLKAFLLSKVLRVAGARQAGRPRHVRRPHGTERKTPRPSSGRKPRGSPQRAARGSGRSSLPGSRDHDVSRRWAPRMSQP